jgi:ATP-dependent DNA helicase RecQ
LGLIGRGNKLGYTIGLGIVAKPTSPAAVATSNRMPPVEQPPPEAFLPHFGLETFRAGQRDVIEAVLTGHDCLCIMPTGGGKSLCYQLPSVARTGTTLVISPLIALMKDQVDGLTARGIRATFINSSLDMGETRQRLGEMASGGYDLVYIAPERLRNKAFQDAISGTRIQLLAVDEAHCISEWGHDFRPDYARLGQLRERLGNPQTIALTATATPIVRKDVVQLLRLNEPQVFITGFARPNLHLEVRNVWGRTAKFKELLEFLNETPGAGIVYASTRKRCEEVAEELSSARLKRKVKAYHAGLEPDQRRAVQDEFMSGQVPVIVATNAFGMGIDKRDLRFVVHFDMPGTLEAYYQEAGRAGRDGGDSHCLFLFNERDREVQEWFIENSYPPRETIALVYDFLRKLEADPIELTLQEVKDRLGLSVSNEGVAACEKILEKAGALERLDTRKNMASVRLSSDLPTLVELLPADAKKQRKVLRTLEKIAGDTRHEYVFFPPGKLEAMAELDSASILRALRELQKLDVFDYVPPFRGRAIRMKIRDLPFAKLDIDFAELNRRKEAELEKVQQVVDFAHSHRCRQIELLDYFGDPAKAPCEACDNCGGLFRKTGVAISISESVAKTAERPPEPKKFEADAKLVQKAQRAVQMALSGAARAAGKVGKIAIARMLCGSDAKTVKRLGFDKLSTFGLLASWRRGDVENLLEALLRLRLLEQRESNKFRPVVQITERGRAVMRGEETADVLPLVSDDVRAQIRTMPLNSTPTPVTPRVEAPIEKPAVVEPPRPASPLNAPPHYWTWRLLSDGYSWEQCLQIRNLDRGELLNHLLQAVDEGLEVPPEWALSAEKIERIEAACRGRNAVSLRTLIDEMQGAVLPGEIELYLAATAQSKPPPTA